VIYSGQPASDGIAFLSRTTRNRCVTNRLLHRARHNFAAL